MLPTELGNRGFVLNVDSLEAVLFEDYIYRFRIAQLNGLPVKDVRETELTFLYRCIIHAIDFGDESPEADELVRKYLLGDYDRNKVSSETEGRILGERVQQFCQQAEGLLDEHPRSASYGIYIPSYMPALVEHQMTYQLVGQPASLLLGALTQDTVYEFGATIHALYPDARCTVVDISGQDSRKVSPVMAQCVEGNALSLDVRPSTQDSVHSNYLLGYIGITGDSPIINRQQRDRVFSQAYKVLKPGGLLVMVEKNGLLEGAKRELDNIGFKEVSIEPAEMFKSRRFTDRFLRGTSTVITQPTTVSARGDLIVAIK